jgi:ATP-dependent Clp endopeptidase proteolytic subunit ClpP
MKFGPKKINKYRHRRKKLSYHSESESDSSDDDYDYNNKNDDHNHDDQSGAYEGSYYLYGEIKDKPMLKLNKFLKKRENEFKKFVFMFSDVVDEATCKSKPVDIYINSEGGLIYAAVPIIDIIQSSKVPIHTHIEGIAASAASLISVVGHYRTITKNSFMLIHEVRGGVDGKFGEIKDEFECCNKIMDNMRNIYRKQTGGKLPDDVLEQLLVRDVLLTAEECLKYGLVDEIV